MSVLEMKVPSPGESITEVEIAAWLVEDGDYVEKDQPIAEVDSDKATLELPAEESGIITLKAEEGDAVNVGEVVCLIDMSAAKPASDAPKAPATPQPEVGRKRHGCCSSKRNRKRWTHYQRRCCKSSTFYGNATCKWCSRYGA